MATLSFTQERLPVKITTTLGEDKLLVTRLQGQEALSSLFHYTVQLISSDSNLDLSGLVNTEAVLELELPDQSGVRHIHGVITRFVQGDSSEKLTRYVAELRPWTWYLGLSSNCRIFQQQNVPDIIDAVFADLGNAGVNKDWRLERGNYQAREYCVQYKESHLNFVSRLLEEEGIFYFFEHAQDKHTLVLADDSDKHQPCPVMSAPRTRWTRQDSELEDVILESSLEQTAVPAKQVVRDYDYLKPPTDLTATVSAGSPGSGLGAETELFDYPGGYLEQSPGESKARRWLEAYEASQKLLHGSSSCRSFIAGYSFTLDDHSREDINQEWVLRSLKLQVDQDGYRNKFTAHPKATVFRPPRRALKPRVAGTETALCVGKSGEEIEADDMARIRVQFHWDRLGEKNEQSTCAIRVVQPWAGSKWGSLFLPRIGQEVVVQFIDGDPDRPLVTGTVYNADNMPPYDPSSQPTVSSIKTNSSKGGGGFNELRFEDKKDSEEIYIHAQKNMTIMVKHDRVKTVEHDETNTIKNHLSTTVQEGNETHAVSKGTRSVSVEGDEDHTNAANFTHTVAGNYTLKVDGDITIEAGGNITIKAGSNFDNESGTAYTITAGTSLAADAGTSFDASSGTAMTLKGGTDFKAEGSMNAELKGGISVKAEGATATFKGSGMNTVEAGGILTLKGSLAKIN